MTAPTTGRIPFYQCVIKILKMLFYPFWIVSEDIELRMVHLFGNQLDSMGGFPIDDQTITSAM